MRQLKGKVKESRKEKRERKQDNAKNKERFLKIGLPTLFMLFGLLIYYVYTMTRPKTTILEPSLW